MQPFCQNTQLSRSLESELESAVKSGELKLQGKNLKEFPKHGDRYNLTDTTLADLSRNKLLEVPGECTDYYSLERLLLYHNTIRSIPETISSLQCLTYLDISRNQLTYLPSSVCLLTQLQCFVANNNKLVSLPEEIGDMVMLMQLDVSCNEIAHLPVQIGDLANLRSLHLRRNHLQEIPVELTYLQLTFLDLAANRLSSLPVELRFMVTLCDLYLEENPLTCPPANLCGRGRFHIFKYLEIQAIKEDKKRGVLTDGEYRRSYRKTSQLNDMRFGGGLSADARRKRNTADSGYGSEQPLDRRWSQEFSQEGEHYQPHAEDARRLAHRVISHRPATHVSPSHPAIKPNILSPHPGLHPPIHQPNHSSAANNPHCLYTRPISSSPGVLPNNTTRPHPSLTSNESSGGSSGVSSLGSSCSSQNIIPAPPSPRILDDIRTGCTTSPSINIERVHMSTAGISKQDGKQVDSIDGRGPRDEQDDKVQKKSLGGPINDLKGHPPDITRSNDSNGSVHQDNGPTVISNSNRESSVEDNLEDKEKEETRRTAHRVFTKQGSRVQPRPAGRLPLPNSSSAVTGHGQSSPGARSGPSSPNSSGLPSPTPNNKPTVAPSIQTYRQFKEQQKLNRQGENGVSTYNRQGESRQEQPKLSDPGVRGSNQYGNRGGGTTQQKHSLQNDIKSVQKEAVMSYLDRMNQNPGITRAGSPPETSPPPPPTSNNRQNGNGLSSTSIRQKQSMISSTPQVSKTSNSFSSSTSQLTKASSSSIPSISRGANSNGSTSNNRSRFGANIVPNVNNHSNQPNPALNFTVKREADRTAVHDTHIHHLRQQIESRLKVSLGDDLPNSLTDGVVLCHIANHVSPRSVSSIHVPSPAVPKLTAAKCRRNVDNFLTACRKIGVREDLVCSVCDVMEPKKTNTVRVAITVTELLRQRTSVQ